MLLSSQLTLCRLELNVKVCYLHCELKLWQFLDPTDAMILMWQKTKLLITMSWYYLLYKLTILASLGVTHTKVYIYVHAYSYACVFMYYIYTETYRGASNYLCILIWFILNGKGPTKAFARSCFEILIFAYL
jgi:hypothetical protein